MGLSENIFDIVCGSWSNDVNVFRDILLVLVVVELLALLLVSRLLFTDSFKILFRFLTMLSSLGSVRLKKDESAR